MSQIKLGATLTKTGVDFAVWSHHAEAISLCLFKADGQEYDRIAMTRNEDGVHWTSVAALKEGTRYGYRAHGRYARMRASGSIPPSFWSIPMPRSWTGPLSMMRG